MLFRLGCALVSPKLPVEAFRLVVYILSISVPFRTLNLTILAVVGRPQRKENYVRLFVGRREFVRIIYYPLHLFGQPGVP